MTEQHQPDIPDANPVTETQPFEYYLNLIRNGEVLTKIEMSNAKKLLRKGCNKDLETCLAVVLRNRYEAEEWNDWFYNRFSRTPDEEVNDDRTTTSTGEQR